MRVGLDVSPLEQTGAGTARVVRGLQRELAGREGIELAALSFGGAGRASTVLRDLAWYPGGIGWEARHLDVLHCTTMRGPMRARPPVVVTIHDLALLRMPEAFPAWHRHTGRLSLRLAARSADAVVAVSAFTRDEIVDLLDVPSDRIRVCHNGVEPVFTADGPAVDGDYVLAVGTLEPRKNLARAVEAARLAGVELRVVGARGWGGVDVPGWVGRIDDDGPRRPLSRGALPGLSVSLRGLRVTDRRGDGLWDTGRDEPGGATEEVAGGAAVLVDARTSDRSQPGSWKQVAGGTSSSRSGWSGLGRSRGSALPIRWKRSGGSSHERSSRRRGCRRPRPQPHGGRDLRAEPAS